MTPHEERRIRDLHCRSHNRPYGASDVLGLLLIPLGRADKAYPSLLPVKLRPIPSEAGVSALLLRCSMELRSDFPAAATVPRTARSLRWPATDEKYRRGPRLSSPA